MNFRLLVAFLIFLISCSRSINDFEQPEPVLHSQRSSCTVPVANPLGRSYLTDSLKNIPVTDKYCGLLPLHGKAYWIYLDSLFENGVFKKVQYDTLRFSSLKSSDDNLVWWETSMDIGIPKRVYATDSALYGLQFRFFQHTYSDVYRDYFLFNGDSVRYLARFDDIAAQGRSLKWPDTYAVPAGEFSHVIYFEKHARNYRKDVIYFVPGVGILKYYREKAPMGTPTLKTEKISTLVAFRLE
ncbi:MAG: hypothetical protein N2747_07100 [Chitinophagaceae bacterium]|nr:hypothetical protein [Chitinophagaceae bacterium]